MYLYKYLYRYTRTSSLEPAACPAFAPIFNLVQFAFIEQAPFLVKLLGGIPSSLLRLVGTTD